MVSAEAVGQYHLLAWGSASIARASPTVYQRARQRAIFQDYVQTTPLFAVFPGIHVAKRVFVMISSTESSFLIPLRGTFGFYGGNTCAALSASRCEGVPYTCVN